MSCEHPNCWKAIHSICTTHCQWSLCFDHFTEHKYSLLNEFEITLNELIQLANEFGCDINREHLEQETKQIENFEDEFRKISKEFSQIQNNKHLLRTNHFQTIENLFGKIQQTTFPVPSSPPSLSSLPLTENQYFSFKQQCPLKTFNTFGLLPSHQIRLCTSYREIQNLLQHFRTYHRINEFYSKQLLEAISSNLDPKQTIVFPPNENITISYEKFPCPLYNSHQCLTKVTQRFLPIHLKIVHRLRSNQIKDILQNA